MASRMSHTRWFRYGYVEIHNAWPLPTSDDNRFANVVGANINLLERHGRRHINEASRLRFSAKLGVIFPSHAHATLHDVENCL